MNLEDNPKEQENFLLITKTEFCLEKIVIKNLNTSCISES